METTLEATQAAPAPSLPTPFVQAVEVWLPDGAALSFGGGLYGPHSAFAALSAQSRFERGEGLPGTAMCSRRVEVWGTLGERFARLEAAESAALDAAVGIPVMRGHTLEGVVVLLCGSRQHTGGCIEVWEPDGLRELKLSAGYYGQLLAFERISHVLRFPEGCGLPGLTWQQGTPQLLYDLRTSSQFVRGAVARECGVEVGLGVPIYKDGALSEVLLLLSASATPLARGFEIWTPDGTNTLRFRHGVYGPGCEALFEGSELSAYGPGEGILGGVLASYAPTVFRMEEEDDRFMRREVARRAGLTGGVAIPIHDAHAIKAVVVLLL